MSDVPTILVTITIYEATGAEPSIVSQCGSAGANLDSWEVSLQNSLTFEHNDGFCFARI